mgnify:CR=1 FL=1
MNRLLRISFDTLLTSLTPIIGWFLLGILVDKNLINIFSLIYPIQFIISTIKSVFGTGANVSSIRDNNKNSVYSGILIGSIIGAIILGIIVINIDKYISFMNMDIDTYKIFGTYGVIQMFLQLLLNLSLCKLYFEDENKRANKYSFSFNIINFSSLILLSIITKEQIIIAGITTIVSSIFVAIMLFRLVKRTKIQINILNCIKYDAVDLFHQISMFIIFLFGFKTAFDFGEKYILAISFSDLITDMQWDVAYSIKILAQIDITKKVFSYKEHLKSSKKLIYILITSVVVMGAILYPFYHPDIIITLIMTGIGLICIYMYPVYVTKMTYLQMEFSAIKATISKQTANVLRIICSFLPTPFCTTIGLMLSATYQLLSTNYYITKNKLNMEMREERKLES